MLARWYLHLHYNAAIVLANLMDEHGRLNHESRVRMDTAIEAYRKKEVPLLVTCGWAYRADSDLPIAHAMKAYAVERHSIPVCAVIAETTSRDTVGDAVFTKRNLAIPKEWTSILVVTSTYHVKRTQEVFSFIYGPQYVVAVTGAPSLNTPRQRKTEQASTEAFRSTFQGIKSGDDKAILRRLTERHPFYNGTVYP